MTLFHNIPKSVPTVQSPNPTIEGRARSQNNTNRGQLIRIKGIDGAQYSDSDWSDPFSYTIGNKLDTPSNLRVVANMLIWNSVPNATSYEVKQNNTTFTVNDTSISLIGLPSGSYTMSVRAIGDSVYADSDWSSSIDYSTDGQTSSKLDKPSNLRVEDEALLWDDVENAQHYEVEVNGEIVGTVDSASFDISGFESGEYIFRVKAIGDDSMLIRVPSIEQRIRIK